MSDSLTQKLKNVEDDIAELRKERATKVKARDEAREQFAGDAANLDPESDGFKTAMKAVEELGAVDDKLNQAQIAQVGILKMLGRDSGVEREVVKAVENGDFIDPETASRLKSLSGSHGRFGQIDLGQVISKAELVGTTNSRRGTFGGITAPARRQLTLLDIIPTGTMDGNSFPYVQEGGTYGALEVAELAVKPEAGITLTDAQADAKTIAHWKKLAKQALEDVPALRSVVNSHLVYGVQRRLEGQILVGDGTGANLTGIRSTAGIQSQAHVASTPYATLLLSAISKVFIAEGQADAIVVNPADWVSILSEREGGTSGGYLVGGDGAASATATQTLWGVPLIPNANQPVGFATVGDFGMGAQVFVRSGIDVLLSDSDQDDFIKNRVTLLGEMRAALAVWRPGLFVNADIAA